LATPFVTPITQENRVHEKKQVALVARLRAIAATMRSDAHCALIDSQRTTRDTYGTLTIHFSDLTSDDVADVQKKFAGEDWSRRYGQRTLRGEVLAAIAAALEGQDLEAYVTTNIERLESGRPRHSVLVPLSGIFIEAGITFDFGRVRLVELDAAAFDDQIASHFHEEIVLPTAPGSLRRVAVSEALSPGLYATYTVDGDGLRAIELIDDYVSPVADYLQFCLAVLDDDSERYYAFVDYKGRYTWQPTNVGIILDERGTNQPALSVLDERQQVRATITNENFKYLHLDGIAQLAQIFGRPIDDLSEYEQLLYRAVRVFAEGERSHSRRQRILSYVTAVELFFTQGNDTTRAVTEGIGYALGTDYATRKRIIGQMQAMYNDRSSTTHDGLEPADVRTYRHQVWSVLRAMIRLWNQSPAFQTKADSGAWIDRLRFSGPAIPPNNIANAISGTEAKEAASEEGAEGT
jgi:hypothetical protein